MANSEHLDILKTGFKFWNQWRQDNPDIIPDLKYADLNRADLRCANLSYADLTGANFRYAILNVINLKSSNLRDADLTGADLTGADLTGADLTSASLRDANLTTASLTAACLFNAKLNGADLKSVIGANLSEKQKQHIKNISPKSLKEIYAKYRDKAKSINFGTEHNLQSQMQTIREELEEKIKQSQNPFTQREDKAALEKIITDTIQQNIADNLVDKFGKNLQKRTKYASLKADITKYINHNYDNSSGRYGKYADASEVEAQSYQRWGIWLLAIGILVPSITFIVILFAQYPDYKQWDKIFIATPITLLSEGLAFFLFSLSQKEKERMRAFSSEQCNLDLQKAGYLSLVKSSTLLKLSEHLARLSETKQPYILKKNERTIEESHNKNNIDALKDMAEIIKPVISK